MSGPNPINIVFAIIFIMIGAFMSFLGISFLFSGPSNETEWTITLMSLVAAFFLFYGARQTWQNHFRQQKAEKREAERLHKLRKQRNMQPPQRKEKSAQSLVKNEAKIGVEKANPVEGPSPEETEKTDNQDEWNEPYEPKILAHWLYPKREWNTILSKLAEKTKKEELYTAFWFPVLFALVFWSMFWVGIIAGLAFGVLYVWFRVYFVKQKFALQKNQMEAEVIVTDSYLNVNGNFIHYGDGKYYLRGLTQEQDAKLGQLLCFNIGWLTSKGLPAQMDLFLPVPLGREDEANAILHAFKEARK